MHRHVYQLAIGAVLLIACSDRSCPAGYMLHGDQCRRCKPGEERERGQCVSVLDASTDGLDQQEADADGENDESAPESEPMTPGPDHERDASAAESGVVSHCQPSDECAPALSGLALSVGTLTPALSPDATQYVIKVGLSTQTLTLVPSAPDRARISIAGSTVASGQRWTSEMLSLGENHVSVVVSDEQSARTYDLSIVRGYEAAFIKASNTDESDSFGTALAASRSTLVVGAPGEDSSARTVNGQQAGDSISRSGAAYVFERVGDSWIQQAYLKPSQLAADDAFGQSVAIDGDTIAVAAPAFNRALAPGAVYIFERQQGIWSQQARVSAPNTGVFGASVSISGDVLVVGATREGPAGTSGLFDGAAYVFVRAGDSWTQQTRIAPPASQPGSLFGANVAASGNTIAIGATFDSSSATGINGNPMDSSAPGSGAVYLFARGEGGWSQEAYIKASNTGAGDHFGHVALAGDTLVVGAPYEDSARASSPDDGAVDSGAVYVFTRSSGLGWIQQAYLKASNPGTSDLFGSAVSIAGDLLAVGAFQEDSASVGISMDQLDDTAMEAGAAYCFVRRGGAWRQEAYVKGSNTAAGDRFGLAVAASEHTLAVGAPGEDSSAVGVLNTASGDSAAASSGAVYVLPN